MKIDSNLGLTTKPQISSGWYPTWVAPDTDLARYLATGYPANLFAIHPVSGWLNQ